MSGLKRNRWTSRRCIVALALLCLGTVSIGMPQQVYKWTDAAGTIHYSEQPPPEGVKNTQVKLSSDSPTEGASDGVTQPEVREVDPSALDKANDAQEKHLCSVARQNLKLLDSDAMIASGGDIKTATQLAGEDREKARREARAQVTRYCHDQ